MQSSQLTAPSDHAPNHLSYQVRQAIGGQIAAGSIQPEVAAIVRPLTDHIPSQEAVRLAKSRRLAAEKLFFAIDNTLVAAEQRMKSEVADQIQAPEQQVKKLSPRCILKAICR